MRIPRVFAGLLLTGMVLVAAAAVRAQGTAAAIVTVTDARTGSPVARATVTVKGVRSSWITDSAGTARIEKIQPGQHPVRIEAAGYAPEAVPVEFAGAAPVGFDVQLTPAPLSLKALEVAARKGNPFLSNNGFFDRERVGGGTFIWGPQLEKLAARRNELVEALRGVSGFIVLPNKSGYGYAVLSTRGVVSLNSACYPQVYLDGMKMPYPSKAVESFNDILPLDAVAAIEAYAGSAYAPMEYGRHPCGTILIWMKHGGE